MSRLLPFGFAVCLGVALALPAAPVAAQPPRAPQAEKELVDKVRDTIKNGVTYLKNQQTPQGNWEGVVLALVADMDGGQTALVTLALLNCGEKPDDPKVAAALKYLEKLEPKKTYVAGLCNLVFAETRDAKYLPKIQKNADWLIDNALGWRDGKGRLDGWSYPQNQMADNSNTQYALLGLYAAKQAGAKIKDEVWKGVQEYYTRTQYQAGQSGYWTYFNEKNNGTISMTVAGVCGLLIAAMGLDQSEQELDPKTGVAANCGAYSGNTAVAKGMNWVADHFSFESPKSTFYNIYGMERLGRISGQRFIGTHDWYREGCAKLVKMQDANGAIVSNSRSIDGHPLLSTSFGLLFLSKGRTPVLISKFAWGDFQERGQLMVEVPTGANGQVNWNRKHNDTRHVVEFCSEQLFNKEPLSWQVYDARRRDFGAEGKGGRSAKEKILEEVGQLLQSPVLYLNGHGPLVLTPVQEEILQTYVEEGGFLLAEACCGDPVFAKSFKATMKRLFPANEFKPIPAEHGILRILPGVLPTDFPDLEVLERGCRTVAVFSPSPLAGYWEEAKYMPKDGKNPQNRGEKAFCLARNVVAYATGMERPKPKLTVQKIERGGVEVGVTRSHFKPVQLQVGEEPIAPDSLKNLMGYLRDNARLDVALRSASLPPSDDQLATFKFMYLHGRKPLELGEAAIENIQANLQTGGLLLVDAACGGYQQWKNFDKSFREACAKLFPKHKLEVIQPTSEGKEDPLFRIAREAGIDIKTVRCRRELPNDQGPEPELRNYPVLLEGIKIDGRWVVIYSKYDIGCAIEGHKSAECLGHDKDSALRIASAVVLYSLKR
jgi:hypothetical protein